MYLSLKWMIVTLCCWGINIWIHDLNMWFHLLRINYTDQSSSILVDFLILLPRMPVVL